VALSQMKADFATYFRQSHAPDCVPLSRCLGRVLAENVVADCDMPAFDRVGVDGYAFQIEDLHRPLAIVETVTAGQWPRQRVGEAQCSRVMTGAPLPQGANTVVKVEDTVIDDAGRVCIDHPIARGSHVTTRGSELKAGQPVLPAGTRLGRVHLALLAAVGCHRPCVAARPRVSVMATGTELVPLDKRPGAAQVRNANTVQLCASVREAGGQPYDTGIVADEPGALRQALEAALAVHDVVVLTGGGFGGDHDYLARVLGELGLHVPEDDGLDGSARHVTFGFRENRCVIGLPGFPVSSFVYFEILVKPFLLALQGHVYHPLRLNLILDEAWTRRRGGRDDWSPVAITPDRRVRRIAYGGSGHIHALAEAQGLARLPRDTDGLAAGETIEVQLFQ